LGALGEGWDVGTLLHFGGGGHGGWG
jgi:hypothetical protein